jgi:hypothetical protein
LFALVVQAEHGSLGGMNSVTRRITGITVRRYSQAFRQYRSFFAITPHDNHFTAPDGLKAGMFQSRHHLG